MWYSTYLYAKDQTWQSKVVLINPAVTSCALKLTPLLSVYSILQAPDKHGITPLLSATYEGHLACVKILLEKVHMDVDSHNSVAAKGPTMLRVYSVPAVFNQSLFVFVKEEAPAEHLYRQKPVLCCF